MERVDHILEEPVQVPVNGELQEVQAVTLVAPSKKVLRKTFKLQQMMTRVIISSQQVFGSMASDEAKAQQDPGKEVEFDAATVTALLMASDIDIEEALDQFNKLALSGCLEVNDQPVSSVTMKKFNDSDLMEMLSVFLANFIVSLVMKNLSRL